MTLQVDHILETAYGLIQSDQFVEAESLIRPLIATETYNPDVWWVYAHALRDKDGARLALQNVLRLDPEYPGASDLLHDLDSAVSSESASATVGRIQPIGRPPQDLPDEGDKETDFEGEFVPVYRRPIFVLLLGFAIIAMILILSIFRQSPAPVVTASAQLDSGLSTSLAEAFSGVALASNGISLQESSLGNTLTVTVCTSSGSAMREALRSTWEILVQQSKSLPDNVDAMAVHLVECVSGSDVLVPLRRVMTEKINVVNYADGVIDERTFQSGWRVDDSQ